MKMTFVQTLVRRFRLAAGIASLALAACGGQPLASGLPRVAPELLAQASSLATARFVLASPKLEESVGGLRIPLGITYLQVNGATFASAFPYGTITQFAAFKPSGNSVTIYDSNGYRVGPLPVPSMEPGKIYSLVIVGSYPKYRVLAFAVPPPGSGSRIVALNASSRYPKATFGTYAASANTGFRARGTVAYGKLATVPVAAGANIGAYIGHGTKPFGGNAAVALSALNSFDTNSRLPFENVTTLTIFVVDPSLDGTVGPLLGNLDQ